MVDTDVEDDGAVEREIDDGIVGTVVVTSEVVSIVQFSVDSYVADGAVPSVLTCSVVDEGTVVVSAVSTMEVPYGVLVIVLTESQIGQRRLKNLFHCPIYPSTKQ